MCALLSLNAEVLFILPLLLACSCRRVLHSLEFGCHQASLLTSSNEINAALVAGF